MFLYLNYWSDCFSQKPWGESEDISFVLIIHVLVLIQTVLSPLRLWAETWSEKRFCQNLYMFLIFIFHLWKCVWFIFVCLKPILKKHILFSRKFVVFLTRFHARINKTAELVFFKSKIMFFKCEKYEKLSLKKKRNSADRQKHFQHKKVILAFKKSYISFFLK